MTIKLIPIGYNFKKNIEPKLRNPISYQTCISYLNILRKIIIILVILIIIIFIFRFVTARDSVHLKNYIVPGSMKDVKKLQTGDLVFVSYSNTLGYFMRGLTRSVWTHVGMIMRYKDKLYVMESADYSAIWKDDKKIKNNGIKNNGILVIPFEKWKSLNSKMNMAYTKLDVPLNWDRRLLIQEFLKIQESKLDSFSVGTKVWNKVLSNTLLWKSKYNQNEFKTPSNITCSEMIIKIYQNAGVIKKIYSPGAYSTKDIVERKIEFNPGFRLI
jgi:hypothetical protein